jgi:ADP-ribose diphosphatase
MKWPRIRSRRTTAVSPWMGIIAREVEFSRNAPPQVYHAVEQADYVSIIAITGAGKIPIVRQYRPALEGYSWELPAGMVDAGETPAECCRRELLEETGLTAQAVHDLGENSPCTGRLSNRIHSFFVEAGVRVAGFRPEPGLTVKLVPPAEITRLIKAGEFASQLHLGALLLADLHGFLTLPRQGGRRPRKRP